MINQSDSRSRSVIAIVVGFLVTLGLNILAFIASKLQHPLLSSALIWPNTFLQCLTPLHNIGTAERPIMEGTPLNFLAFMASVPFAWLIYSLIAYVWLRARKRDVV